MTVQLLDSVKYVVFQHLYLVGSVESTFFRFHYGNISQIAVKLVIVQAESDYETIRNFETAIIYRNLHDTPGIPIEKGADRE